MIYVTRREVFSASHRLHNPNISDKENNELFGKCNNLYGHGHNYVLEVTVCGNVDKKTGYVIDLKILKELINTHVISQLDHKYLNNDVDFLVGKNPTTEILAIEIWNILVDKIPNGKLYSIKLHETENNVIEYKGEETWI